MTLDLEMRMSLGLDKRWSREMGDLVGERMASQGMWTVTL